MDTDETDIGRTDGRWWGHQSSTHTLIINNNLYILFYAHGGGEIGVFRDYEWMNNNVRLVPPRAHHTPPHIKLIFNSCIYIFHEHPSVDGQSKAKSMFVTASSCSPPNYFLCYVFSSRCWRTTRGEIGLRSPSLHCLPPSGADRIIFLRCHTPWLKLKLRRWGEEAVNNPPPKQNGIVKLH